MELNVLNMIQEIRTPWLDECMVRITHLGDVGVIWIGLAIGLLINPRTRKTGKILTAALVLDVILCNGILKNLFHRMRPFTANPAVELLISAPRDYSFPSGHTAMSFAATAALYFAGEKKLWKFILPLAIAIAFSRMYLYVHYPTDILGGSIVGITAGYGGYRLVERLR